MNVGLLPIILSIYEQSLWSVKKHRPQAEELLEILTQELGELVEV